MNIEKLPKWAQSHIADLQRERDVAVKALKEMTDTKTPSNFYSDDMRCIGEEVGPSVLRTYFQTHKMTVKSNDDSVLVHIHLRDDSSIEITAENSRRTAGYCAFTPRSFGTMSVRAIGVQICP